MPRRPDVVVIGAGIVGLATARQVLIDQPNRRVLVLDKEDRVAAHQSSHNSGVVHAGIYYAPGSKKAELCTAGKTELERYCTERGIPLEHNGKVVVAVDEEELPRLDALEARARANRVQGLRRITGDEIRVIEPSAAGIAGLHSPRTGVVDFPTVADAFAEDVRGAGGEVRLGTQVRDLDERDDHVRVTTDSGEIEADVVIACAGLQSDRLAATTGDRGDERIVPFRGSWLRLRPESAVTVNGNIYPVPDPRFPFLGVHATRRIDGEVWIGPNAVLAGAREGYRRGAVSWRDVREVFGFRGFWQLAARHVKTGARELWQDRVRRAYLKEVRRYLPMVTLDDLESGPSGIRAQSVRADGSMVDDFSLVERRRVVHVKNAPSPAATASMAIGRVLAVLVEERG